MQTADKRSLIRGSTLPGPVPSLASLASLPGLALCAALAALARWLCAQDWARQGAHLSLLVAALMLAVLLVNLVLLLTPRLAQRLLPTTEVGALLARTQVLRAGVALLGLKLSLHDLAGLGAPGVCSVLALVAGSLCLCTWLGRRLGLAPRAALLLAAGLSICGASAVAATSSALQTKEDEGALALGVVTLLGSLCMLLYPLALSSGLFHAHPGAYGYWVGASIHEVGQVVAAGFAGGELEGERAALVKLVRVGCLVPLTLACSWWCSRAALPSNSRAPLRAELPGYLLVFLACTLLVTLELVPAQLLEGLLQLGAWLLALAMAGLGLTLRLPKLLKVGGRALLAGTLGSLALSGASLGVALWLSRS